MNTWTCKMCRNEQPSYKGKLCENCGYHPYIAAARVTHFTGNYWDEEAPILPHCYTCGVHRNDHPVAEMITK